MVNLLRWNQRMSRSSLSHQTTVPAKTDSGNMTEGALGSYLIVDLTLWEEMALCLVYSVLLTFYTESYVSAKLKLKGKKCMVPLAFSLVFIKLLNCEYPPWPSRRPNITLTAMMLSSILKISSSATLCDENILIRYSKISCMKFPWKTSAFSCTDLKYQYIHTKHVHKSVYLLTTSSCALHNSCLHLTY